MELERNLYPNNIGMSRAGKILIPVVLIGVAAGKL
jgi:hypothetical protein